MTLDGWRDLVIEAVRRQESVDLLSRLLAEQDRAKSRLSALGFGCIGMPWAEVIDEIEQRIRELERPA